MVVWFEEVVLLFITIFHYGASHYGTIYDASSYATGSRGQMVVGITNLKLKRRLDGFNGARGCPNDFYLIALVGGGGRGGED